MAKFVLNSLPQLSLSFALGLKYTKFLGVQISMRIDVPIWYEDAHGEQEYFGKHAVLLPHEIVGAMYRFPHVDLTPKLLGDPGVLWLHAFHSLILMYPIQNLNCSILYVDTISVNLYQPWDC